MRKKGIPTKIQRQLKAEETRKHPQLLMKSRRTDPPSESGLYELWTFGGDRMIAAPFKTMRKALKFAGQYAETVRHDVRPEPVEIDRNVDDLDDY